MTIALIPMTNEPAQALTVTLGTLKYQLDVQYNDRSGVWTLSMQEDATDVVLFQGVPLLVGVDILEPYNYEIGKLMMVDNTSAMGDAGADNFGDRFQLYWVSPDEELV